MLEKAFIIAVSASLLMLSFSCSDFRKIQKSSDWKLKYDAAIKYYENEDYYRSTILFEEIMPYIRGSKEAEQAQFFNAYAHYYQKDFLLSSHYFQTFYETYNRSAFAEEALYMYAYSLYRQSPNYNLDQTSTLEAIEAIQVFLNRYPASTYREDAVDIMSQLMNKLEKKAYENAKLYYDLGYLKSALISFDNFQKDHPDSKWNQEVAFYMVEGAFRYAKSSIPSKQKERYYDCVEYYQNFVDEYADSGYLKKAEDYYTQSLEAIEQLTANNL
jgi:outer membrane protein assembly factor BamD